jgi:hypothetical protein
MTEELPEAVAAAFDNHDAYEPAPEGVRMTTAAFDGIVTVADGPEWRHTYTVTVRVPTLQAATSEPVGAAVTDGWFETFERRLEDAPTATRTTVELADFDVIQDGEEVIVTYSFALGDADTAARVAKTFVEYVEGTYVEGVIPGYEYESPVADLVSEAASAGGDGEVGGTPL